VSVNDCTVEWSYCFVALIRFKVTIVGVFDTLDYEALHTTILASYFLYIVMHTDFAFVIGTSGGSASNRHGPNIRFCDGVSCTTHQ